MSGMKSQPAHFMMYVASSKQGFAICTHPQIQNAVDLD